MFRPPLTNFLVALVVAQALALVGWSALRLPTRRRAAALLFAVAIILATPFFVPAPARFLRLLAAIAAVTFTVKLYDLHVGATVGVRPTLAEFEAFLWNIYSLVHRRSADGSRRSAREEVGALLGAVAVIVPALALLVAAFRVDWRPYGFAPEHAAKAVTFFLVLMPLTALGGAAWRLAGGQGVDFMDNPFAARTPADFWRRYNRPVHQFFQEDLFKPAAGVSRGRRAAVVPATLATFLVSAAVHEYVFSVAVGRVDGYQTAFFLLQGLAVVLTLRVKPRGWAVVPWVAATFAFNLATGVLFFASFNHIVPLYRHRPPVWGG